MTPSNAYSVARINRDMRTQPIADWLTAHNGGEHTVTSDRQVHGRTVFTIHRCSCGATYGLRERNA